MIRSNTSSLMQVLFIQNLGNKYNQRTNIWNGMFFQRKICKAVTGRSRTLNLKFEMHKRIIILLLIFGFIITNSFLCFKEAGCHYDIDLVNNSNKAIYHKESFDSTLFSSSYNPMLDPAEYKIESGSRGNYHFGVERASCIERLLNRPESDTLFVYIFDANVVETTPSDTVRANNLYLKCYDLSLQDLQSSNWTITYP